MKWIYLFVILTMLGCSQKQKKESPADFHFQSESLRRFEEANKLLDSGEAGRAAVVYDQLTVENPASPFDLVVLYNAGVAHLQSGNCPVAGERFRRLIRLASQKDNNLKGRSMLYMSDVYACLGEDNKAITILIEIYRGRTGLPVEKTKAEIPAKLAAAYARIGNNKEAAKYFLVAEKGLTQIQGQFLNSKERRAILARTLYAMGHMPQVNTRSMSSADYFITVQSLQKYLYKAVEYNDDDWSRLAADKIIEAYDRVWTYIDHVPLPSTPDRMLAERNQKNEKILVAYAAREGLRSLFSERIPDPNEPAVVSQLMQSLKRQELKLSNYIASNMPGTGLTHEAMAAESLRRVGRVLNPNPILEERSMKAAAKGRKVPQPPKDQQSQAEGKREK